MWFLTEQSINILKAFIVLAVFIIGAVVFWKYDNKKNKKAWVNILIIAVTLTIMFLICLFWNDYLWQ